MQKFLMVFLMPLYTAYLTPAQYGIVGMVTVFSAFIYVFINFGFDLAMSRFYFDNPSEERRRQVISNTFFAWTIYPPILLGLLAAFMPHITPLLMGDGDYWRYFDIGLLNIFFTNWNAVPFMIMRLDHKPWLFSWFMLARVFVQVVLTVLMVVVFRWGVYGVLLGTLGASFVMNTASLPTYWRRLTVHLDRDLMRQMSLFALPALLNGAVFFVLKLSDRWFLMRYWGQTEVGLYTTAFMLSQPVYVAMSAFRMAWPQWHFARLNDPTEHKKMVARSSTYFLTVCVFMMAVMGVIMPILVRVLARRSAYWSIGPTALVLTLGTVLYSMYFVLWVGCSVAKKNRLIPLITIVASAANLGLNFLLIPKYGMIAAAWTTVIGFAILCVLVYFISQHHYPIRYEWVRFVKLSLATAATLGAAWALAHGLGERTAMPFAALVVRQLIKAPTILLFPLVLWLTGFFTPGERQNLRAAARRLLKRGEVAPSAGQASTIHPADALSDDDVAAENEVIELEAAAALPLAEGDQTSI